jgi:hypothetical protein
MKQHAFTFSILNWQVCAGCGLICLRNEASRRAMRKACPGKED